MTTAADIGRGLGGVKKGGEWLCRCPAHADHNPSLSIAEKGGKVLLTCRAGCTNDAVIEELRRRDLWSKSAGDDPPRARIGAVYSYRDASGTLRYQVVRQIPKGFYQRRPNGRPDAFINNMAGVEPLPYRLPELLADPDATIYIAEGEKDCDALAELGLIATTNHGGAGKWRSEISRWFTGRRVVILPDNDDAGRAHANDVAAKLAGIADARCIIDLPGLPAKGDCSDWIAAGGTADQIEALVATMPLIRREPDVSAAGIIDAGEDAAPISPRGWLLGNTFCRCFISGLLAQGAGGKTALRIAQALALATGRQITGEHVFLRCRVLIVSLEDNLDELRRRVRAARLHHGISAEDLKGWFFLWAPAGSKVAEQREGSRAVVPGELERLLRTEIIERQIDLVMIDPLVKAHGCEENDNTAIDAVAIILARLAADLNCAVDTLHHERKGAADAGDSNRGRGASSFRDAARLLYTVTGMTDAEREQFGLTEAERRSLIRLDSAKVNISPPSIEARWFRIVGVPLGNGTELYPRGDEVPTVEPWVQPDLWREITATVANDILDQIERGPSDGRRYSPAKQTPDDRAAWRVVQERCPTLSEKQCKAVIVQWTKAGMLESRDYLDPLLRKSRAGLFVTKRPG